MVGYNNESYDYPLLHHILNHFDEYKYFHPQHVAQKIYEKSQEIIDSEFTTVADKNKYVKQLDLYKIWHYNNPVRRTSLKDLEYQMHMDNLEEMPLPHTAWCDDSDIDMILEYNKNDVEATYKFFLVTLGKTDYPLYKGKNKLELRINLTKKFGVSCLNLPDVRIGESLMLNLYSQAVSKPVNVIRQLRTERDSISLSDCIPPWCNIKSKEFNQFVSAMKTTCITGQKGEFAKSIIFHSIQFDFGTGGCHACIEPGVYKSDDKWVILDLDVSSLYPSIAKSLGLYPEHLGPEFIKLYSQFIDARIAEKHKPKAERDNVLIEGYKLLLNGTYGKSGEDTSFLYDLLYKYRTTFGGQCFICMWAERMAEAVPELVFIQVNTDGITIKIPRDKLDVIRSVNNQLTKETSLIIEEAFYKQMIIRDVNNYISEYDDSTPENEHLKLKGCFEIDKEYHKDSSMRIVPIALKQYYIHNIPIKQTIMTNKDIFNFCLRLKVNSQANAILTTADRYGEQVLTKLNRTTRYYVSTNGGGLSVQYKGGKVSRVNVGCGVTVFNKFEDKQFEDYKINYNFYIGEANKIKDVIDEQSARLF